MPVPKQMLLQRYAPYFYFDRRERYYPCSITEYVRHAELHVLSIAKKQEKRLEVIKNISYEPNNANDILLNEAFLQQKRAQYQAAVNEMAGVITFRLKPDHDFVHQERPFWRETPIYGEVLKTKIIEESREKEVYALYYMVTYTYDNPTTWLPARSADKEVGWHYGDIEHVTIYLDCEEDNTPGDIYKIHYSAHGSGEGEWIGGAQIKDLLEDGTHPRVYVARGTHAHYATAGNTPRLFRLADDEHQPLLDFTPWMPRVSLDTALFYLEMDYGYDHVSCHQSYLDCKNAADEKQLNSTHHMRLFGVALSMTDSVYEKLKEKAMFLDHTVTHAKKMEHEEYALLKIPEQFPEEEKLPPYDALLRQRLCKILLTEAFSHDKNRIAYLEQLNADLPYLDLYQIYERIFHLFELFLLESRWKVKTWQDCLHSRASHKHVSILFDMRETLFETLPTLAKDELFLIAKIIYAKYANTLHDIVRHKNKESQNIFKLFSISVAQSYIAIAEMYFQPLMMMRRLLKDQLAPDEVYPLCELEESIQAQLAEIVELKNHHADFAVASKARHLEKQFA